LRHTGLPDAILPIDRERWSHYLGRLPAAARGHEEGTSQIMKPAGTANGLQSL